MDTDALGTFLAEILAWNPRLGLVSKQNTAEVLTRLVRASITLWEFVCEETGVNTRSPAIRVADVGSGAGFPGIVWKLLSPEAELALIERKERRAIFLERVVARLGFEGVEVVASDLRSLASRSERAEAFDIATLMAVGRPQAMGTDLASIVRHGGWLVARRPPGERPEPVIADVWHLTGQRATPHASLVLYEKR